MKRLSLLTGIILCCTIAVFAIAQPGTLNNKQDGWNSAVCPATLYVTQSLSGKNLPAYAGMAEVSYSSPISDNDWSTNPALAAIAVAADAQGYQAECVVLFDCDGKIVSVSVLNDNKAQVTNQVKLALTGSQTAIKGYIQNASVQFYTNVSISISSNKISVL